ncbi:coiled-coil domain-containing protein [Planctomicrobium piriforme]|uniref:Uncharacterized protein n=1 Tax=Planctomicrobium piriforme TaxID=1576369 RepID=A0A1I3GPY1_9PLAN|nr:hypothetical protein [Planctomicrobium piriforme]SFI25434.1 hypothetical protein SAMN05421753_10782 [Planctomicrobium piriforme]
MISRRRLTLQLTPLLDMLLIVVFLQYFQLRDREQTIADESTAIVAERDQLAASQQATKAELAELMQRMAALQSRLSTTETQATEAQIAAERERESLVHSQTDLERSLAQQRTLGELVNQLFQISPDEVSRILNEAKAPGDPQTPAEREKLKERFRDLSSKTPGRMIEHLLSYEEIRKRADIWDLHIDAKGVATLSDGQRSTRIRIPMSEEGDVLTEQFVNDLFTWYRSLPQPKSLVVILLTYDRSSRIYVTESVRAALPIWVTRMQADSAGRTRFEYADLGFRLE